MKKKVMLFILLSAIVFGDCADSNYASAEAGFPDTREINSTELKGFLGSEQYVNAISRIAKRQNSRAALNKVMEDVENNSSEIDNNNEENNLRLYKLVSSLVYDLDYVDMRIHYFRNKLNRAPESLKELLDVNSRLPVEKRWKLLDVNGSLYHMQGKDGEFNLKFVSGNGFCEAVYNKKGVLLTEENDPVNMGTFNYYALIGERAAHKKFDVDPYLIWGNAPDSPQKGESEIQEGEKSALENYNRNISGVLEYRNKIMQCNGDLIISK